VLPRPAFRRSGGFLRFAKGSCTAGIDGLECFHNEAKRPFNIRGVPPQPVQGVRPVAFHADITTSHLPVLPLNNRWRRIHKTCGSQPSGRFALKVRCGCCSPADCKPECSRVPCSQIQRPDNNDARSVGAGSSVQQAQRTLGRQRDRLALVGALLQFSLSGSS
jgi:hypothetical protein